MYLHVHVHPRYREAQGFSHNTGFTTSFTLSSPEATYTCTCTCTSTCTCKHSWHQLLLNLFHAKGILGYKHQRMSIKTYTLTYTCKWRQSHYVTCKIVKNDESINSWKIVDSSSKMNFSKSAKTWNSPKAYINCKSFVLGCNKLVVLNSFLVKGLNPLPTNDAPMRDLCEPSISLWEFIWGF